MADRYIELRGQPVTSTGASTCLLNIGRSHLANICEPSRLLIKLRAAAFDTSSFEGVNGKFPQYNSANQNALDPDPCFSGSRTGLTLEGPFLEYSVATGSVANRHTDAIKTVGVQSEAVIRYYFDLMTNRTLLLPWQGSIDIITQYPGTWQLEWYLIRSKYAESIADRGYQQMAAHPVRQGSPLDADATLTFRVAPDSAILASSRLFNRVPPGSHSLTYNDTTLGTGPFPTIAIQQEDSAGAKAPGPAGQPINTSVPLVFYGDALSSYMCRIGHHNSSRMLVTSGNAGASGFVQWHLQFV